MCVQADAAPLLGVLPGRAEGRRAPRPGSQTAQSYKLTLSYSCLRNARRLCLAPLGCRVWAQPAGARRNCRFWWNIELYQATQ